MAQTTTTDQDMLPHVAYQNVDIDHDDPAALFNRVSATNGSITIVSAYGCSLVLNWSFSSSDVTVAVELQTPVGSVDLINADLNQETPSVTFGGSVGKFKAEGTVSFNVGSLTLTASGQVCAPWVGCKSGSVSVNV